MRRNSLLFLSSSSLLLLLLFLVELECRPKIKSSEDIVVGVAQLETKPSSFFGLIEEKRRLDETTGWTNNSIEEWASSLRNVGFKGDIYLLTSSSLPLGLLWRLQCYHVIVQQIPSSSSSSSSLNRRVPLHHLYQLASNFLSNMFSNEKQKNGERVFVSETNVRFQKNPFHQYDIYFQGEPLLVFTSAKGERKREKGKERKIYSQEEDDINCQKLTTDPQNSGLFPKHGIIFGSSQDVTSYITQMNFQLNNLMLKRENKERGGEGEKEREREKEKEKGFLESCEKRGRTFLRLGSFLGNIKYIFLSDESIPFAALSSSLFSPPSSSLFFSSSSVFSSSSLFSSLVSSSSSVSFSIVKGALMVNEEEIGVVVIDRPIRNLKTFSCIDMPPPFGTTTKWPRVFIYPLPPSLATQSHWQEAYKAVEESINFEKEREITTPNWIPSKNVSFGHEIDVKVVFEDCPLVRLHSTDQFASGLIFHHLIGNYPWLTNDPEEADLLFIPAHNTHCITSEYRYLNNYCKRYFSRWKSHFSRFWCGGGPCIETKRQAHFLVGGRGYRNGYCLMDELRHVTEYVVDTTKENPPSRFVGIPYPILFHGNQEDIQCLQNPNHKREYKAAVLMSPIKMPLRYALLRQCSEWNQCATLGELLSHNLHHAVSKFHEIYRQSVFCLQPPGDSLVRRGIFDSLIMGCIPVLLPSQRNLYPQFWPWQDDVVVYISEKDQMTRLKEMLLSIDKEWIEKARRIMRERSWEIVYPSEISSLVSGPLSPRGDVFSKILFSAITKIDHEPVFKFG